MPSGLPITKIPEEREIDVLLAAHERQECTHEPDEWCEKCCEHRDLNNFHCIDCGADRTEHIMSREFDRAKGLRKYGHY